MIKFFFLFIFMFSFFLGASDCDFSESFTKGKETMIDLSSLSERNPLNIRVVYGPDSDTVRESIFPFSETFKFVPERAGIIELIIDDMDGEQICSVKRSVYFDGLPLTGILIFLFAGSFLFTGTFLSLKNALKD